MARRGKVDTYDVCINILGRSISYYSKILVFILYVHTRRTRQRIWSIRRVSRFYILEIWHFLFWHFFFYCGANRSLQRLPSQRILRECTGNRRFYVIIYEQTDIYIYSVHIGTISKDTVGHCRDTYPGVLYIYLYRVIQTNIMFLKGHHIVLNHLV